MNFITSVAIVILSIAVMLLGVAVVCNDREIERLHKDVDREIEKLRKDALRMKLEPKTQERYYQRRSAQDDRRYS